MPPLQADKLLSACKNGISIINRGDIMKTFIKTIAITLCLSVTMLFFSSSKKVEAASAVVVSGALYVIAAIVTAVAVGLGIEVANEVSDQIKNGENNGSFVVNNDGTVTCDVEAMTGVSEELKPVIIQSVSSFNTSTLPPVFAGSSIATRPSYSVPSKDVNSVVENAFTALYKGSDTEESSSSLGLGVAVVDGKPQKVVISEAPTTVEIFDYLELSYHPYNNIFDIKLTFQLVEDIMANGCYHRIYIIKDNILYVLSGDSSFESSGIFYSVYDSRRGSNVISFSGSFGEYLNANYYGNGGTDEHSRYITKLANVNGSLCLAFFNFHSGYNKYNNSWSNPSRFQYIFGYPSEPTVYPVLFNDTPTYDFTGSMTTTFKNYPLSSPLLFVNPDNPDIRLSESDVLSGNYDSCGFIMSQNRTQVHGGTNGTLTTASRMMSGAQGNVVSGGTKTTYSELSDLEKSLYALAKQQGITYEQMLEQSNIVIKNGEMYIEGLDGVQHSIESLLSEFEKLLEQGSISNEQGAIAAEQLTALLTYLKSLNIEGINQYVAQIESTLDEVNSGNKDNVAILGDVLGQLRGLSDYLDSLGLSSVGSNLSEIKTKTDVIADSLSSIVEGEKDDLERTTKAGIFLSGFLTPVVSRYNLYDQCKYFLDNLFNYDDINTPPDFSFFWDSDGDGIAERYTPLDLSFLEMTLTNENLADKTWFFNEIKVIDFIRYLIAIVIYGFFIMRLLKRLPGFYGLGPLSRSGG